MLANGYELPVICMGTDIIPENYFSSTTLRSQIKRSIRYIDAIYNGTVPSFRRNIGIINCAKKAIEKGCVFFDTSRAYGGSERMLYDSLRRYERNEYYICTKLSNYHQIRKISARDCLCESMERLGVNYVDLYLLHWPVESSYLDYWKQLENLYEEGMVKAIGVSNCKIHHLEDIKKIADIMPMVDEVELHPLLSEMELRKYCKDNNIQIMAYTSTARLDFRLRSSRRLEEICERHKKNLAQVILRWHIQNGIIPIFNTSSIEHLKENMSVFDFELNVDDMLTIESININARTRYDSDNCEWDRL